MLVEKHLMNTEDIPSIRNRDKRFEELFVDCYGQSEELSAIEVYFTDAMHYPFEAEWRDLDEPGHAEAVTVLKMADVDVRRGVLLAVQRAGGKQRRVLADQLWAKDKKSANAIVLNDYRHWVGELNGLTPGFG
jgi:hypothetical protein